MTLAAEIELARPSNGNVDVRNFSDESNENESDEEIHVAALETPDRKPEQKPSFLKAMFSSEKKKEEGPKAPIGQLFRFADKLDILLIILGSIGAAAEGATMPIFMIVFGDLFNAFNKTQDQLLDEVIKLVIYFVYIGIGSFVATLLLHSCWTITSERQTARCREAYVRAILRQEVAFYDKTNSGVLAARVASDTQLFGDAIGEQFGKMIQFLSTFVAGFVVGFVRGWKLTLVILALTPLLAVSGAFMMKTLASLTAKGQTAYAQAGAVAAEVLAGIRTVASFSGEPREVIRYAKELDGARAVGYQKGIATGVGMGVTFLIMFGSYGLALWYGAQLIIEGEYTGGTVITVFFSVLIGAFALGQSAPSTEAIGNGRGAAVKIFEVIDRVPAIDSSSPDGKKLSAEEVRGEIELRNVDFRYPTREDVVVFKGMNLTVKPGETVALVGPSGCGKSSTVALIERLYDPLEGEVVVDGHNIRDYNLAWYRQQIGLVGQEPVLFSGTIADNIAYGKPGASAREIKRAAKLANAHKFIKTFPDMYDTLVGEKGAQLSGGQKQRIAIARAIIKDPKILLLDEATSALDTASEKIVQEALDRVMKGRTTIVVAHRLSTIRNADWIAVFDGGKVAEKGTHAELMELNGIYATLVKLQEDQSNEDRKSTVLPTSAAPSPSTSLSPTATPHKAHREHKERAKSPPQQIAAADATAEPESSSDSEVEEVGDIEMGAKAKKSKKELKREQGKDVPLSRIFRMNLPELPFYFIGLIGAAIMGAINPAFALVFAEMVKVFYLPVNQIEDEVVMWAALFAGIGGAALIGLILQNGAFGVASEKLTHRLRLLSFKAMLRQEIAWFDLEENATGVLTARLATDASLIEGLLGARLGLVFQNFLTISGSLIIAFIYGWKLALVVLACGPLFAFAQFIRFTLMKGNTAKSQEKLADANRIASEAIGNIRTVAAFTHEELVVRDFRAELAGPKRLGIRSGMLGGLMSGLGQFINFGAQALVFWYGAVLVRDGDLSFIDMLKVIMAILMAAMSIGNSSAMLGNITKAKTAAREVFKVIDRQPKINVEAGGDRINDLKGEVKLRHLNFAYPTRPNATVFADLSLELRAGHSLAIVGPSGSGKSSIVSMIERFYDPNDGSITADDHELKQLELSWWRQQIALVGQEPVLFVGSIAENIAYGKPGASREEIEKAAQAANAHKFIMKFPKGYDTPVGEKGAQLSGGQKQRIAIARAVIRNPKILLLDEATSALDTESEKVVQRALDNVMQGRTTVIVAHRLSTVRNADRIAVLDSGRVVELGGYHELLEKKGHFYNLVQRQVASTEANFKLSGSLDKPRDSLERSRGSMDHSRGSMDRSRGSIERQRL